MPGVLAGLTILVVEDSFLIAEHISALLQSHGGRVVGPAPRVDRGLELARDTEVLDGAVLDVNLAGEFCYPLAVALGERGVPFVFLTGYDDDGILPPELVGTPRLSKPVDDARLLDAVTAAFVRS